MNDAGQPGGTVLPTDAGSLPQPTATSNSTPATDVGKSTTATTPRFLVHQEVTHTHLKAISGPIPDPSSLAEYDRIIPNGADRIMRMAEMQHAHRIQIEGLVLGSQQRQSARGQVFGLVVSIISIGASMYAALQGKETFACVLGGTTVVGLVTAFLASKQQQRSDLAQKKPPEPNQQPAQMSRKNRKKNRRR